MKISVVTTEKNEVKSIEPFIQGVLAQSYSFDELIICDGGSTDGTIDAIKRYVARDKRIRLIIKPGNRSVGRNEAVRQARNEIIAVTDVGTVADKDWLRYLVEPFEKDSRIQVVGGFFKIAPQTFFEEVSASLMLSDHDRIDPNTWLPSSRSIAFTKDAWSKIGGYPEHTSYNEDTPFDLALRKAGYNFAFAKKALVYWRPRPNLRSFFKQYYNYAIGDGIDLIHARNYVKKISFYLGLAFLSGLSLLHDKIWFVVLSGTLFWYWLRRSRHMWQRGLSRKWILYVPLIIGTKDVADVLGFTQGVFYRLSNVISRDTSSQ